MIMEFNNHNNYRSSTYSLKPSIILFVPQPKGLQPLHDEDESAVLYCCTSPVQISRIHPTLPFFNQCWLARQITKVN